MTTIATREDTPRPAKRVSIEYKRQGQLIKTKVRESLYRALETSKKRLAEVTGNNYSQTIFVRRALDLYLEQLAKMDEDKLITESKRLVRRR